jgi:hypothetical protein
MFDGFFLSMEDMSIFDKARPNCINGKRFVGSYKHNKINGDRGDTIL